MADGEIVAENLEALRVLIGVEAIVLKLTTVDGRNFYFETSPEGLQAIAERLTKDAAFVASKGSA